MVDELKSFGSLAYDIQEIVIPADQIQQRVSELGRMISLDYFGRNPLLVGVLKGVLFFFADLLRALTIPAEIDFIAVSSYTPEARDDGIVRLIKDLESPINNRHIIFVEDVIDTGLTLDHLLRYLRSRDPASLEVCVLFNKPTHRMVEIPIKYKGFDLPDYFVVGYGLDHKEKYRQLPFLGLLKSEVYKR